MEKIYLLKEITKSLPKTLELVQKFKTEIILNEIFIGKILGDGSINKTGNLNFCQSIQQKEYIEHCFQLFKPYLRPNKTIATNWNKRAGKIHEILYFDTCAIFKEYLPIFYRYEENTNKRIKIVPGNIGEYLTLRGIGYWIMDDGMFHSGKVHLCTHSFTLEENLLLISVLQNKFGIFCSIARIKKSNKKNEYWNIIKILDTSLLWNLVKDFILPCFYYKFGKGEKPISTVIKLESNIN